MYKVGDEYQMEDPMTGEIKKFRVTDVKEIPNEDGSTTYSVTSELII